MELGATSSWATAGNAFEWNKTAAYAGAVEGHSGTGNRSAAALTQKCTWWASGTKGGWNGGSDRDHIRALGAKVRTLLSADLRCSLVRTQPGGP